MATDQHNRDAKAIQELTQRNRKLEKRLLFEQNRHIESAAMPPKTRELGRSSVEAYVGYIIATISAVFPMTWWIRAILLIVVCGLGTDMVWRSPLTIGWHKAAKSILVLLFVGSFGWAAWGNVSKQYHDELFPPGVMYFTSWGPFGGHQDIKVTTYPPPTPPKVEGYKANQVGIAGDLLAKFADRYRLIAICFQSDGMRDIDDEEDVSKSTIYDIRQGNILMGIPWTDRYTQKFAEGQHGTTYQVLLVPKQIRKYDFSTTRDAVDHGVIVLQTIGGPP
jgi:hypothetical protein